MVAVMVVVVFVLWVASAEPGERGLKGWLSRRLSR